MSYFSFSSSSSIWLDFALVESSFLLIFLNLNDLSWNLMSLVSFDESVFSHNLMKIPAFTSLSLFLSLLVEVFSSLIAFSFFLSLMLSQNLISPWWTSYLAWWSELSLFLDEHSFLNLMPKLDELFIFSSFELVPLSSLRTLRGGAKTKRSTLPHLGIKACILIGQECIDPLW